MMKRVWVNDCWKRGASVAWKNFYISHVLFLQIALQKYNAIIFERHEFDFLLQFETQDDYFLFLLEWL